MFDFGVGYSELLLLAVVAIIVIGPKDLPKVLRGFGQFMARIRKMSSEFQGQVDIAMRDAGMEDVKNDIQSLKSFTNPTSLLTNPLAGMANPLTSPVTPKQQAAAQSAPPPKNEEFDELFDTERTDKAPKVLKKQEKLSLVVNPKQSVDKPPEVVRPRLVAAKASKSAKASKAPKAKNTPKAKGRASK